ncbi:DUF6188 family protein [Nocardia nova]|uniref:DUF6188 family protein n=1 Tax=Nocardia nova TaxID=37330 RepID=UPI0033C72359
MKLSVQSQRVMSVDIELTVTFTLGDKCDYGIQIEGMIEGMIEVYSGDELVDVADQDSYGRLAPLLGPTVGRAVTHAEADDSGRLFLSFDNGIRLRVPSDESYEAWNVTGPDGYLIVSQPGGGLAIWSAGSDSSSK